jgi:hypothetical protein
VTGERRWAVRVLKAWQHPFWRAFLPVGGTYALTVAGLMWGPALQIDRTQMSPIVGGLVVLLFTVSHAVVPVFFYRAFFAGGRPPVFIAGFIYFHMGMWFGIPIVGLAAMTNWLSLAWVAVHMGLARRGTRVWVYLENGSTSLALLLFLMAFSGEAIFPWGVIVVACQSTLLTVLEYKARRLWVTSDTVTSDTMDT